MKFFHQGAQADVIAIITLQSAWAPYMEQQAKSYFTCRGCWFCSPLKARFAATLWVWENVSIKCLGPTGVSHHSSVLGDSVNGQFQQSFPTKGKAGRGFDFFMVKVCDQTT